MNERRAICGRGTCWEEQIVGEGGGGKRVKGGEMVGGGNKGEEGTSGGKKNDGEIQKRRNKRERVKEESVGVIGRKGRMK